MVKFIEKIAREAGALLMARFYSKRVVSMKSYRDIVTEVDTLVERKLIQRIHARYPQHSILSEEVGLVDRGSADLWVLDPLDGTVNYASGIPLFSVSIAFIKQGQPMAGVVFAPYLNECFSAEHDRGAFLNGKRIHPSPNKTLAEAVVHVALSAHYSPKLIRRNWRLVQRLPGRVRGLRMLDSGALTSCYVACGRLDGKFSIKTDPFGNAASTVIVEEAGGVVRDFQGHRWNVNMKDMICSSRSLYPKLRRFVA